MFKNWFGKKKEDNTSEGSSMTWEPQATQALDMAMQQAPVPKLLKNRVRKELEQAAEEIAKKEGRTTVTPTDLMNGMMAKIPDNMKGKVQDMIDKKMKGQGT